MPKRLDITDEERKKRQYQAQLKSNKLQEGTGIVYKLSSPNCCEIYIGSTTYKLRCRLNGHKFQKKSVTSSLKIIEAGDVVIEELELVVFGDEPKKLIEREYYYINTLENVINVARKSINPETGKYDYGDKYKDRYKDKYDYGDKYKGRYKDKFGPEYYKEYYKAHKGEYAKNQTLRRSKALTLKQEITEIVIVSDLNK